MTDPKRLQSYHDLEIYRLAKALAVEVHSKTLNHLPKFEMYEVGSQIRRSAKSVGANIVEGFGRKKYRGEYVQFLTYALASCSETQYHLEVLQPTGSLNDEISQDLLQRYQELGRKIHNFRKAVLKTS